MLNAEQLKEAKGLPGAAHITAENADVILLQSCASMHAELNGPDGLRDRVRKLEANTAPTKLAASQAEGYVKLFLKEQELQVKDGKMTPAQLDLIKLTLNPSEGKYAIGYVQNDGTVLLPSDVFSKTLEMNKPNGVQQDLTGAQPAVRTEPGKGDSVQAPSFEQINANRATYQLAPITMEEYTRAYPQPAKK
jgi:hypothetical protein